MGRTAVSAGKSGGIRQRLAVDQLYEAGADVGVVAQHLGQSPVVALKYYRQATAAQTGRALRLAANGEDAESNVERLGWAETQR